MSSLFSVFSSMHWQESCLQNLPSWSTWQICKQTPFLFLCASLNWSTRLWTKKQNKTKKHWLLGIFHVFIFGFTSAGVVWPKRYAISLSYHRTCRWFWCPKVSYLTCPDCFHLSIFYADNSTMHMDQIQWKSCYCNSSKNIVFHMCMFFIFLSKFYGKQSYFQKTLWVCIYLTPFRRMNDNNLSGKLPAFTSKWTQVQNIWIMFLCICNMLVIPCFYALWYLKEDQWLNRKRVFLPTTE